MSENKGFTLIEIIVMISVLSVALLMLTGVFPLGFEAKHKAENYSTMGLLAQSLLEEIGKEGYKALDKKYPPISPGYGKGSGKFKKYPGINWQVEWWQTDIPNLRKIKVKVYGKVEKEGSPQQIEIVTYLANKN